MAPDIAAVAADARWLANRYDESQDAIHFVRLTREEHRAVTFITDEYSPAEAPRLVLRRRDVAAAAGPPPHRPARAPRRPIRRLR